MSKITLRCIKDGGRLRIRFHSFTNDEGKVFTNVYNNKYNCRFPKKIRKEGLFYEIPDNDMSLVNSGNRDPFYSVKKSNIKILHDISIFDNLKIFAVDECVICLYD